jgi:hypothetical protein
MSQDALPGILKSHPHVRNASYMGQETLAELVEEWYHHCHFILDPNIYNARLFRTGRSIWGLSDLDVSRHIRHVIIDMYPREMDYVTLEMACDATGLPIDFADLDQLRKPATVILNLVCSIYEYDQLAEEHLGVLERMIDAGVKVAVMFDNDKTQSGYVGLEHLEERSWTGFLRQVRDCKGIPVA